MFCWATSKQKASERSSSGVLKSRNNFSDLCSALVQISINHSGWLSVIISHKIKMWKVTLYCHRVTQKFGSIFQFFMRKLTWYIHSEVVFSPFDLKCLVTNFTSLLIHSLWQMQLKHHCRQTCTELRNVNQRPPGNLSELKLMVLEFTLMVCWDGPQMSTVLNLIIFAFPFRLMFE